MLRDEARRNPTGRPLVVGEVTKAGILGIYGSLFTNPTVGTHVETPPPTKSVGSRDGMGGTSGLVVTSD